MVTYCIVVNESMMDAGAWIERWDRPGIPTVGPRERVYSTHETYGEAEKALPKALDYAHGRRIPNHSPTN